MGAYWVVYVCVFTKRERGMGGLLGIAGMKVGYGVWGWVLSA